MSVVTRSTRRRWVSVAAGVAALFAVPAGVSAVLDAQASAAVHPAVSELVAKVEGSASIPHSGQAESRGNLGLPDLPRLGDVAARLGGTTDTRVWWAGEDSWRVDVLTATGEQGTYASPDNGGAQLVQWDFEANRRTVFSSVAEGARLPRADDLLPPAVARRLLSGSGGAGSGDRVVSLPDARRVAGRTALGLRLTPGDRRSTIGHVDIWADAVTGLPLAVTVTGANGATALDTFFTQVSFRSPAATSLRAPAAPGSVTDVEDQPDIVSRLQRFGRWRLPTTLAGLRSTAPVVTGVGTYGPGLTRIVVVPLPPNLAWQLVDAGHDAGGKDLGLPVAASVLIRSGALSAAVVGSPGEGPGWVVAGLVTPETVEAAARALDRNPPEQE